MEWELALNQCSTHYHQALLHQGVSALCCNVQYVEIVFEELYCVNM